MKGSVILDVSPWALTFFTLTLIGSTMNDFWSKLGSHPVLGGAMIVVALCVAIYASFVVIWRHDPAFVAGASVYYASAILLVTAVPLCYVSYTKTI